MRKVTNGWHQSNVSDASTALNVWPDWREVGRALRRWRVDGRHQHQVAARGGHRAAAPTAGDRKRSFANQTRCRAEAEEVWAGAEAVAGGAHPAAAVLAACVVVSERRSCREAAPVVIFEIQAVVGFVPAVAVVRLIQRCRCLERVIERTESQAGAAKATCRPNTGPVVEQTPQPPNHPHPPLP